MRTIRHGVFETNSSSTHALCIDVRGEQRFPKKVKFDLDDYGWEYQVLDMLQNRANYLWAAARACQVAEYWKALLRNHLSTHGIECEFVDSTDEWDYPINHSEDLHAWLSHLANSDNFHLIDAYLFGKNSCVFVGNDNEEYDDNDMGDKAWQKENPKGEVYWKGN